MNSQKQLFGPMTGPVAWIGSDIVNRTNDWMVHLSPDDIADLELRPSFRFQGRPDLGEYLAHPVGSIMRRVCCVASAVLRKSSACFFLVVSEWLCLGRSRHRLG